MREQFLGVTSLADWGVGETSMLAVLALLVVLSVRTIIERERAMTFGKGTESLKDRYEQRWRTGRTTGS